MTKVTKNGELRKHLILEKSRLEQRKRGDAIGAKTISFPKGRGHLTHNNREFISKNVDVDRVSWNRVYKKESLEDAYENCFGQAVREYNAAQKRKDRRKENYLKEIEHSGNGEKVFYENVVQIGKVTDTPVVDENGNLTESAEAAIEVLEEYAKTFQERNPNLYLFNCVMHLDEATPHLHMDYIPVAHGYKTGLKTRNSLTKAFQEMGFEKAVSKKENETVAWQQRERNYLTELCKEHGIEVEILGVQRENLSLPEYKSAMQKVVVLEQQAEELHAQIEELEEKEQKNQEILSKYDLRAKDLKTISEEAEMEAKKVKSMALAVNKFFGSEEYVKVKKSDWNKITDIFKRTISRNLLLETYEKKICGLEKKVSKLTGQIERRNQFMVSKDLEQAYIEFEKSLQPKTFKQKLEEKKEEAFRQNQKRNMEKQEVTNKKRFQRE